MVFEVEEEDLRGDKVILLFFGVDFINNFTIWFLKSIRRVLRGRG